MIHNGTELQSMTFNGQEVDSWIHNGVEIYSGKSRLKYLVRNYSGSGGVVHADISVYNYDTDELLKTVTISSSTEQYYDECVSMVWGGLISNRWVFTYLVDGEVSVDKAVNNGLDYGGTSNQILPYYADTTITFITDGKYKI